MVTLIREDGQVQVTDFHGVFQQLPREVDVVPILSELGWMRTVSVTLIDGTKALVKMTAAAERQPELFKERALPKQSAPLGQIYQAHCKVLFDLAVTVVCTAVDEEHAKGIISEVLRGKHIAPPGFQVVLDGDLIEAFITKLKAAIDIGDLGHMDAHDVVVTELAPLFNNVQRQLEYRP